MNTFRKFIQSISFSILLMCIATTIIILLDIYLIKDQVSIQNIIIRYIVAVIIGFLWQIYISFVSKLIRFETNLHSFLHTEVKQKELVKKSFLWLKTSFLIGILSWGFGMGTFSVLIIKFIVCLPINTLSQIILIYKICLLSGFAIGIIVFIPAFIAKIIIMKRNRNEADM